MNGYITRPETGHAFDDRIVQFCAKVTLETFGLIVVLK